MAILLRATSVGGMVWEVRTDGGCALRGGKMALQHVSGVPVDEQRLLLGGEDLADEAALLIDILGRSDFEDEGSEAVLSLTLVRRPPALAEWLERVKEDGLQLRSAPQLVAEDPEVVFAAVRQNGMALQHAPPALKCRRDVVLAAVQQSGQALELAPPEFQACREVVLAAVGGCGNALEHASEDLKQDVDVVRTAVRQNGHSLLHAAAHLRNDRSVLTAVPFAWWMKETVVAASLSVLFAALLPNVVAVIMACACGCALLFVPNRLPALSLLWLLVLAATTALASWNMIRAH